MAFKLSTPRESISAYTHLLGMVFSAVGTLIIAIYLILNPSVNMITGASAILFCLSMVALYSSSTVYHWCNKGAERIKSLRRLDHAMIYVLIAGTYTPILLLLTPIRDSIIFTLGIWCVALVGILIKLCWLEAPRWLSTSLYILMGWSILLKPTALMVLNKGGIVLLALGGISYTIGGIIYAVKKPNISRTFGFHELFHIFVLIGSMFHFFVIFIYVL